MRLWKWLIQFLILLCALRRWPPRVGDKRSSKGTNMDNGDQGSTGRDARTGAWVVMQYASQPPYDLRSRACVPKSTYFFRNFFRAAILYADFRLRSMKTNAPQQLRKRKKPDCRDSISPLDLKPMLWPHGGSHVPRHTPSVRSDV